MDRTELYTVIQKLSYQSNGLKRYWQGFHLNTWLYSINVLHCFSHTCTEFCIIVIKIASYRQGVFCLWLQRPLCSCVQWWRTVLAPHRLWECHQLPKWDWHIRCWRCFGGWLTWESLSCSSVLQRWLSSFRVWVPLCQGKCNVCNNLYLVWCDS